MYCTRATASRQSKCVHRSQPKHDSNLPRFTPRHILHSSSAWSIAHRTYVNNHASGGLLLSISIESKKKKLASLTITLLRYGFEPSSTSFLIFCSSVGTEDCFLTDVDDIPIWENNTRAWLTSVLRLLEQHWWSNKTSYMIVYDANEKSLSMDRSVNSVTTSAMIKSEITDNYV